MTVATKQMTDRMIGESRAYAQQVCADQNARIREA